MLRFVREVPERAVVPGGISASTKPAFVKPVCRASFRADRKYRGARDHPDSAGFEARRRGRRVDPAGKA